VVSRGTHVKASVVSRAAAPGACDVIVARAHYVCERTILLFKVLSSLLPLLSTPSTIGLVWASLICSPTRASNARLGELHVLVWASIWKPQQYPYFWNSASAFKLTQPDVRWWLAA
jgi:hypothetical protein